MNRYLKISAALAAFALLLVVMGLSTQSVVQAQSAVVTGDYVCAYEEDGDCEAGNSTFTIALTPDSAADAVHVSRLVSIYNNGLARGGTGIERNPRTFRNTINSAITITVHAVQDTDDREYDPLDPNSEDAQFSPNGDGAGDDTWDLNTDGDVFIKAFSGDELVISYTTGGSAFGTDDKVLVDNIKPSLVENSPSNPLIVTDGVNVTFSADITDTGSGFTGDIDSIHGRDGMPAEVGNIDFTPGETLAKGSIQLWVAGNNVGLSKGQYTKIDDGWRVTRTVASTSIQNISANAPWYFEVSDRAGNITRSAGSIAGKTKAAASTLNPANGDVFTVTKFAGNLAANTFNGTRD